MPKPSAISMHPLPDTFMMMPPDTRFFLANGLPDRDPKDLINLNNLDDWLGFHAAEIA